jgi:phosphatidylglycerol:prolipoprotein diacylglycerol transferase
VNLDFDAVLRLGDRAVRWDTLALAGAVFITLALTALIAGRTAIGEAPDRHARLRRDDLLFIAVGSIAGAVVGGRAGYVLINAGFYREHPELILDPGQGALQLSLGVVVGVLAGMQVARFLDGSPGRWLHVAAVPVLAGIGLGKVAMAIGGAGQGLPSVGPLATAYVGDGPWGSLGPSIPSHPAQLYEAAVAGVVLVVLLIALAAGRFRRRDGSLFLAGLGLWALGRFVVAFTWRDPPVIGPLRADQVLSLVIVVGCVVLVVAVGRLSNRAEGAATRGATERPLSWPDPETRPRF